MKPQNKKLVLTEVILITFVWLVLLITPVLFRENSRTTMWMSIERQLALIIPLMFLFLVNRFFLVPKLLFKGKQLLYIGFVLGFIVILTFGIYYFDTNFKKPLPRERQEIENQIAPPIRPPMQRQPRPIPPFANFIILSILVVGFDIGLRSGLRRVEVENEKVRLDKEKVATQLLLLRNQVSPHFFMNTLNNIHSLVDVNTEEAKEAIIKLSKMMRYLLYETESEETTLKKEVDFLESYIDLMKLRFNEKVRISLKLPANIPEKTIPPFLFTAIIENAFKHGVSYKEDSFIDIDLISGADRLLLIVKNSNVNKTHTKDFSGIGLENTRKRLNLIYGNKYHLDIIDNDDIFTVTLSIPI